MSLKVSVIATVFNEEASLPHLLDSLASQTRCPDEVVIVDGGSTDRTLAMLAQRAVQDEIPLRVHSQPGANISQGRNTAIAAAQGDIIAVTDAGVDLVPEWLAELVAPFERDPQVQMVAGFFVAAPQTPFEVALGATVLPVRSDIDPARFLPSSRSVSFRKQAWAAVGGYPEWLDYCEDLILDLELRHRFGSFVFAPQAVAHFRPRPNLKAFFKQYYRYARGDGKADLWRRRHAIRYVTYGLGVPVLIVLAVLHSPWWLLGLAAGAAIYLATPYRRLAAMISSLAWGERLYAIAMVPCIRVTGDLAKMVGYPVGWAWRLQHRREIPR